MQQVGVYEAKIHLSKLINAVSDGKRIEITKHGKPIAMLSPCNDKAKLLSDTTIMKLKEFRKDKRLNGLNLKTMIEQGRD